MDKVREAFEAAKKSLKELADLAEDHPGMPPGIGDMESEILDFMEECVSALQSQQGEAEPFAEVIDSPLQKYLDVKGWDCFDGWLEQADPGFKLFAAPRPIPEAPELRVDLMHSDGMDYSVECPYEIAEYCGYELSLDDELTINVSRYHRLPDRAMRVKTDDEGNFEWEWVDAPTPTPQSAENNHE